MRHNARTLMCAAVALVGIAVANVVLAAGGAPPAGPAVIGNIRLRQAAVADGRPLPAGTYQVRLTDDEPVPAVGQSRGAERWIEFVKDGRVVGREVATVIVSDEVATVAKGARPKAGTSRVELLKGGDYLRVWIAKDKNYLVNMPLAR